MGFLIYHRYSREDKDCLPTQQLPHNAGNTHFTNVYSGSPPFSTPFSTYVCMQVCKHNQRFMKRTRNAHIQPQYGRCFHMYYCTTPLHRGKKKHVPKRNPELFFREYEEKWQYATHPDSDRFKLRMTFLADLSSPSLLSFKSYGDIGQGKSWVLTIWRAVLCCAVEALSL